ncbi:MAG: hypothetical protein KDA80_05370 [Planctomycetaceae bacterium]|nr:hypothetical protein [Planctomycetaceae bacterium]
MISTDPKSNDLLLLAHCYLTNELSGEERSQFESLLESDLEAQEALADVVLIQEALTVSTESAPARTAVVGYSRSRSQFGFTSAAPRLNPAAIATLACTLAVVLMSGAAFLRSNASNGLRSSGVVRSVPRDTDAQNLDESESLATETVVVWTELRGAAMDSPSDQESAISDEILGADEFLEMSTERESRLEIPDWMLAAVSFSEMDSDEVMNDAMSDPLGPDSGGFPEDEEETL